MTVQRRLPNEGPPSSNKANKIQDWDLWWPLDFTNYLYINYIVYSIFVLGNLGGPLLLQCCLKAQFGAPFVPSCGMVSRLLIGNFVTNLSLYFYCWILDTFSGLESFSYFFSFLRFICMSGFVHFIFCFFFCCRFV